MISEQRKSEIVAAFQQSFKRDNSEEIESIGLSELRDADAMLGDRDLDAGFRIAMRNRISDLELVGQRKHESRIRTSNYVMGIITGLLIAGAAKWLFG